MTKKILDLEIDLMRANERIKFLEDKLEKRADDLAAARKEASYFKKRYEQLVNLPTIHSIALNVSCFVNCLYKSCVAILCVCVSVLVLALYLII